MREDIHGIGKPRYCAACERWRAKIDAKYNKGVKVTASLSELLKTGVSDSIKQQIVADLKKKYEDAKLAYETVAKELGITLDGIGIVRGDLYYFPSRTGDTDGHFVEVKSTGSTCSCPAGRYGNKCWAQKYIELYPKRADPYRFKDSESLFDKHIAPYRYGTTNRVPYDAYGL